MRTSLGASTAGRQHRAIGDRYTSGHAVNSASVRDVDFLYKEGRRYCREEEQEEEESGNYLGRYAVLPSVTRVARHDVQRPGGDRHRHRLLHITLSIQSCNGETWESSRVRSCLPWCRGGTCRQRTLVPATTRPRMRQNSRRGRRASLSPIGNRTAPFKANPPPRCTKSEPATSVWWRGGKQECGGGRAAVEGGGVGKLEWV